MRFILLLCFVFSLSTYAKYGPIDRGNLLLNILEVDEIYQLVAEDKWACLAGNPAGYFVPARDLGRFITEEQKRIIEKIPNLDFEQRMDAEGNMYLYFSKSGISPSYFVMNKYEVKWLSLSNVVIRKESYPHSPLTRKGLVWICKNRWILKKLSKGELTVEDYRFSRDEFIFMMRFCPEEWRLHLVHYAASDSLPTGHLANMNYLDCIIASVSKGAAFRMKNPFLEGLDTEKLYYPSVVKINHEKAQNLRRSDCVILIKKLKELSKLSDREKALISVILKDRQLNETQLNGYSELKDLRKYILKHKDLELLKVYMKRIERRQSVADILVLGEFLQSDLYRKGSEDVRHVILDQCALRQRNEIVWQLADSLNLPDANKDLPVEEIHRVNARSRAKVIMMKFTQKDLGNDPKAWKKWYRDQ